MQNDILRLLTQLSDTQLIRQMQALISRERDATAELVAHLAELDTRQVHLREGYPSLYIYCRDALGLSEWEAYNRIEAARAARRFPVILDWLADGSVTLTAVKMLAPHLTPENHGGVLQAARHKRKAQVEEMVAQLAPRPDVPCSVRQLPCAVRQLPTLVAPGETDGQAEGAPGSGRGAVTDPVATLELASVTDSATASAAGPAPASSPIARAEVLPLSPDRYKLQLTIGAETLAKIRLAKDMLGHAIPSGDDAAVLDRAFTALLKDLAKKKFAETPKPKQSRSRRPGVARPAAAMGKPPSRTPSAAVKRAVWLRDLGRCAFVGTGGHRCNERRFVEFHHVDPYALGGDASVDGIQLRCRRHNDYEGRLYFGKRRGGRELVPEQVHLRALDSTP